MIYNGPYTVYYHSFPNGKYYFGITKQSLQKRFKGGAGYTEQTLMNRAIQKYGWNNIQHCVFASHLTFEEACNIEKILIAKFDTTNSAFGYNLSRGGEGQSVIDGELVIKLWNEGYSVKEIAKEIDRDRCCIADILKVSGISQQDIIFRGLSNALTKYDKEDIYILFNSGFTYEEIRYQIGCSNDTIHRALSYYGISKTEILSRCNTAKQHCAIRVAQYSLNNEYIQTFSSITDALSAVGASIKSGNITQVCKGKRKTAYGYRWRYVN